MADPMQVEVVSADEVVWSGTSTNVIAKTTDGEIGILPGHAPVLAVLQPSAVVIFGEDGRSRQVVAVDGGFVSVSQGRVSILSEYAQLSDEVSVGEAERELAEAQRRLDSGDGSEDDRKHVQRATAQLRAAQKRQ